MKVARVAPFVGKVKEDIDRVFDRFFAAPFMTEPMLPPFAFEPAAIGWAPTLDLTENEKEYIIRLEVPGIHKENLDIQLTGTMLTVTGKREVAQEGKGETYLWQEREYGKFV